jgi:hypothetical protein
MGKQFVISGFTATNPNLRKVADIDILESDGVLLLIEPNHPASQWTGVPMSGTTVENLFAAQAASIFGTSEVNEHQVLNYANVTTGGTTYGKIERSTKGGLHGIFSQADARVMEASGLAPYIEIFASAGLQAWMYTHPDNDIYISVWGQITRPHRVGTVDTTFVTDGLLPQVFFRAGTTGRRFQLLANSVSSLITSPSLGYEHGSTLANGAVFASAGSSGFAAEGHTPPSSATAMDNTLLAMGGIGAYALVRSGATTTKARWPSWIFYRLFIEDLTISGRTYAEVHAIDKDMYTRRVLTPGGRYYGDTAPTNPTTIP